MSMKIKDEGIMVEVCTQHLQQGGVVAFPTETVYGIGALTERGKEQIYALKNRPFSKPLAAHVSSLEMAATLITITPEFKQLWEAFLPGPLTIVVEGIGIRVPAHPLACALISLVGKPIYATSANFAGESPAVSAEQVPFSIPILDGGTCPLGRPSTVIRLGNSVEILREGAISRKEIEEVCPIC